MKSNLIECLSSWVVKLFAAIGNVLFEVAFSFMSESIILGNNAGREKLKRNDEIIAHSKLCMTAQF